MKKTPITPRTGLKPVSPKARQPTAAKGPAQRGGRKAVAASMGRVVHRYQGK